MPAAPRLVSHGKPGGWNISATLCTPKVRRAPTAPGGCGGAGVGGCLWQPQPSAGCGTELAADRRAPSPRRGIWCGIKLNTMHAHGIPSELSVTCAISRQSKPDQVPGTLPPTARRCEARLGRLEARLWLTTSRGLTSHWIPASLTLEPHGRQTPGPAAVADSDARNLLQPGDSHKSPERIATATRPRPRRAGADRCRAPSAPRPPATAWPPLHARLGVPTARQKEGPGCSQRSRATARPGTPDTG